MLRLFEQGLGLAMARNISLLATPSVPDSNGMFASCVLFTTSGLGTLPKPLAVTVHLSRVFGSSASTRSVDYWLCLSLAGKSGIAPPFHYRGLQPNILSSPRYW